MVVLVSEVVPRIHWVQWLRHIAKREEHWSFLHPLDFSLFGNQTMMISMVSHSRKKTCTMFLLFQPKPLANFCIVFTYSLFFLAYNQPRFALFCVNTCLILKKWPHTCIVLHSIAWYCMALHGIAWCCMVLHYLAVYCTIRLC